MRVLVAELGADLVKLTLLDASCLGEGERDVLRHAIVTWNIMRVLVAEVGADLARLTPLDASFEGKLPGTRFGGHAMV